MSFLDFLSEKIRLIGNKIRKIQRSDNEIKRKWVIRSSTIAVILVVVMWVAFLNSSIPSKEVAEVDQEPEREASFFEIFSNGVSVVSNDIRSFFSRTFSGADKIWSSTKERLEEPRTYSFEPEETEEQAVEEVIIETSTSTEDMATSTQDSATSSEEVE